MTRRAASKDPVAIARELLRALGQDPPAAANDAEPTPEEVEQIRELARQDAEEMRRARRR